MQVESYRKWAFTHSAIARPLNRRVVDYALTRKAMDAWQSKDQSQRESEWETNLRPDEDMQMDRRRWIEAKKADIWDIQIDDSVGGFEDRQEVKQERRREIVENYGRGDIHWQPPFGRLLKMRHEASRSIGSRLLDNLFDRVSVQKMDDAAEQAASRLRDRIGGNNHEDEREL